MAIKSRRLWIVNNFDFIFFRSSSQILTCAVRPSLSLSPTALSYLRPLRRPNTRVQVVHARRHEPKERCGLPATTAAHVPFTHLHFDFHTKPLSKVCRNKDIDVSTFPDRNNSLIPIPNRHLSSNLLKYQVPVANVRR